MATPSAALARPATSEYAPYYEMYVSLVPEGDMVSTLDQQFAATFKILSGLDESKGNYRYAEGKWSIKELLGHVIDGERVFSYRAMRFARNDQTPLPGFEQDDYVRAADFDARSLADLIEEFTAVRRASIALFKSLREEDWTRRGTASNNPVSVRGLAYIVAGHEAHHIAVLQSKYL